MHKIIKGLKNTVLPRFNLFIFGGYFMGKREGLIKNMNLELSSEGIRLLRPSQK